MGTSSAAHATHYDHCAPEGGCNWTQFWPVDLPANVGAIEFANDFILDADNPMCWDDRCVSFSSEPIVAKSTRCDTGICPHLWIFKIWSAKIRQLAGANVRYRPSE
jgi:hypothetical protein